MSWLSSLFGDSGAASTSQDAMNQEFGLQAQLRNAFEAEYGNQSAIYNALTQTFRPLLAAGPNQYGFSPGEQAALSSGALQNAALSGEQAKAATDSAIAGGDSLGLPSGAQDALNAQINESTAQNNADVQDQIRQAGYAQGHQNFLNAASALGGVAAGENPLGYAAQSTNANKILEGVDVPTANSLNQNPIGPLLGGLVGGALDALTGGTAGLALGSGALGSLGNAFGSGTTNLAKGLFGGGGSSSGNAPLSFANPSGPQG
jgi:hypothetical protein